MRLDVIKAVLKDYSIVRYSFTDQFGNVHSFAPDTDIQLVVDECLSKGYYNRIFFNIWCIGYLITVNILASNDFTYGIYDD